MATSSAGESKTYWCGQLPQIHLLPRKYYFHRRAWKRCVCRNLAPRKPRLSGSLLKPKPQSRSLKSGINPDSSKLLHGLWKRVGVSGCVEKSVRLWDVPMGRKINSVMVLVESIPSQQSKAAGRPLNTNSFTNKSELLWAISRIRWRFWESFGRMRSFAYSFKVEKLLSIQSAVHSVPRKWEFM